MFPRAGRSRTAATGNRLLGALPEAEGAWLESRCTRVSLAVKEVLYRQDDRIDRLYFPDSGMIALVSVMPEGKSAEIGIVGTEGVIGAHAMYGPIVTPCEALVAAAGEARVLRVKDLWEDVRTGGRLPDLLCLYLHALLIQTMQTAACNKLHSIRQRAARWILSMHDRVGADSFPLTQELLGIVLGARRQSVSGAARSLQRAGLIQYRHGRMVIRNRSKLEAAACECYAVIRNHFTLALPAPSRHTRSRWIDEHGQLGRPRPPSSLHGNWPCHLNLSSTGQIGADTP